MLTEQPRTFTIIALDTGNITGICALTLGLGLTETSPQVTHSIAERPWLEAVSYAERWVRESTNVTLCWERYDNTPGRRVLTAQPAAQMANGALEYVATQCGITFRQQSRGDAKKVVTDAVLRKLKWYHKTKDGHANDASRQAGFFLHQFHPELWLRLLENV